MRKLRIYVDTSVIGGCFDEEFREASIKLIQIFKEGFAVMVISDLTLEELRYAPEEVKHILDEIPEENIEKVFLTEEASALADKYLAEGIINNKADAQHVAMATVNNVDILVSWNFKHLVNYFKIKGFNEVNRKLGYPPIEIRTPQEVFYEET